MNPWFYFVFGRVDSAPRYGSNLIGCELAGQDQISKRR
jgi:hypothetical protein